MNDVEKNVFFVWPKQLVYLSTRQHQTHEKNISFKESLCGFSFELKHLNDKTYTLKNATGNIVTPGYKKIIPQMGLQRENHIGNLIVIFNIQYPETLTEEQVNKLKDIL